MPSSSTIAISVDGPRAWDLDLSIDVTLTDVGTTHHLTLRNGVLIHVERAAVGDSSVQLTLTKQRLLGVLGGDLTSAGIETTGDATALQSLLGVIDRGDPSFNIITP